MKFQITKLLHASFLVEDTERALRFYQGVLGLELDSSRPDLGFPGAWLSIGEQQIHLIQLPNPDSKERPAHGGHDRHIAMQVEAIDVIKGRLEEASINFTVSKSRLDVIFIRDPDGNTLELIGTHQN